MTSGFPNSRWCYKRINFLVPQIPTSMFHVSTVGAQWIIGHVDNRSGFGEDDNNTREVEERDGEEVCSKG